jgi:hypothetical protein
LRKRPPLTGLDESLLEQRNDIRAVLGEQWWQALLLSAGRLAFDYLCLLFALRATGSRPRPSLILVTYAVAGVVGMIPATPGGLGLVEASLTGLLVLAEVNSSQAVLATLTYRLASYWAPLLAGPIAYGPVPAPVPKPRVTASRPAPVVVPRQPTLPPQDARRPRDTFGWSAKAAGVVGCPAGGRGRRHRGVDVVGGRCLIDAGLVQLLLAPLTGRASMVTAERRGEGVGRGIAGARRDLRERQFAGAQVIPGQCHAPVGQVLDGCLTECLLKASRESCP